MLVLRQKLNTQIRFGLYYKHIRTFLSEEFRCEKAWNARLKAPFMQKVNLDNMYYEINQSFIQQGKGSPFDLDVFVNKAANSSESRIDETSDLLRRLRLTEEATNTLDSTSHAIIRNCIDLDQIKELITLLDNRLTYGVFLDHYIASYALNNFLLKKDFMSAAQIATFLMLQEDFDDDLSRSLSLFACIKYLDNMEPFYPLEKQEEVTGKKEEQKIRVKFLRNEFFDDHFDIRNHKHLIGKTLIAIGSKMQNNLGLNIKLLGYTLYEKFEKALNCIQTSDATIFKDVVEKCHKLLDENAVDSLPYSNLKSSLDKLLTLENIDQISFENQVFNLVNNLVQECEQSVIEKQNKLYAKWDNLREEKLKSEVERLQRANRLKETEKIMDELNNEEQKLWYFENEEKINLQIDSKKVFYPKRWFGKKKTPKLVDEGYVPPEIIKHRN